MTQRSDFWDTEEKKINIIRLEKGKQKKWKRGGVWGWRIIMGLFLG